MIRLATLLVGVLLIGGCSAATPDVSPPAGAPTVSSTPTVRPVADPVAISIPAIGVHSSLLPYGLTDSGELAVPPVTEPLQAGYYGGADPEFSGDEYLPGETGGPAVVMGHVDGVINGVKGKPGIFYRLHELVPGNEIVIDRADGSQVTFVVTGVQRYAKSAFPVDQVYGPTRGPELRVITCSGAFDRVSGHYVDNTVVYAVLDSSIG